MKTFIIDNIEFKPNLTYLHKHLHVPSRLAHRQVFDDLAAEAAKIARPKALYGLTAIDMHGDDFIVVEEKRFESRVLTINVKSLNRVFPFVATCGTELVEWTDDKSDMLLRT